ncbi:MAG: leucine-rich repeat domain-containing protein [Prevotella sp.]|nr:leucine-rich repeat domain-containing protein [Prevotella sp.]
MKRTLLLILTFLPMLASADAIEIDGIYYNFISDNQAEVTWNPNRYEGEVVIPESVSYKGTIYSVTSIGNNAFYGCRGLTSITIPNSVTSIGELAFYQCSGLTSVTIGNGITSIGDSTFYGCSGLASITIPNSVTYIGNGAFAGCSGLTSITIGNGVTSIGGSTFYGCSGLTSITIPNSVTSIGDLAFFGCSGLNTINVDAGNTIYDSRDNCNGIIETESNTLIFGCQNTNIPSSVTSIGNKAFYGCRGLTSITIPNSVTSIGDNAFFRCSSLTSIAIPNSVTSICDNAFDGCSGLTSITIPNSVTFIGGYAFANCSGLTSIDIPEGVTSIGFCAFLNCFSLISVTIPNSMTSTGAWTFRDCSSLASVKIGSGVTSIDEGSFSGCSSLTSITIPNSVTSISDQAFDGCSSLTSITIPDGVTFISNHAFSGCSGLISIDIPEGVTSIGYCAFLNCYSLTSVTIPNSVTSIGRYAFQNCSGLTSITIPDGVTSIGEDAFEGCIGLTSITIPNSVTVIESLSFNGCSGLTSVTIPNSVAQIGDYAFMGCSSLTSVDIPNSVTIIGDYAFMGCSSLTSVAIPNSVTIIGEGTFHNCTSLTSITIPNSVAQIGDYAFMGCSSLSSVTIPNSVTSIGSGTFMYCSGLTSVTVGSQMNSIGNFAFSRCKKLLIINCYSENVPETESESFQETNIENITLHVPAASVSAYQATEPWKNFKEIVALPAQTPQNEYRPFIENNKVWKVGSCISGNPVKLVEYYYFDGDTIIDGKTCKQMMSLRYVSPDYPEYDVVSQQPSLNYVGAWYEEGKKVYFCHATDQQFKLMYDFSLEDNGTFQRNDLPYVYVVGPRQTGGIKGFKGVYRDVWEWADGKSYKCDPWMEGVGIVYGSPTTNICNVELADPACFLMSCTVGDEVIYLNDEYDDAATPEGARKHRFDFTHTIKIQPKARIKQEESDGCINSSEHDVARPKVKARMRNGAEETMYGEYNDQQLCINLDPIDDTYLVSITSESGKTFYEKEINAGNIVALNIDISTYAEGRYTVTVENSRESFTGEFGAQTTGIKEISNKKEEAGGNIYNLQGQRLSSLQRGLNIVNGQKIYVK